MPPHQQRLSDSDRLADSHNWRREEFKTSKFLLAAYLPSNLLQENNKNRVLTVYIEGDGLAWETKSRVSKDPTPINPTGLELALKHPDGLAIYLARPCQFVQDDHCQPSIWTDARFSDEVIKATDEAIYSLKSMVSADKLRLVGYSGGGAVAALVTSRREDIIELITVAGNLDHEVWTEHHRISALKRSLNPIDHWDKLKEVPQVHLIGGEDRVVGDFVLDSYLRRAPEERKVEVLRFPDYNHSCCWADNWPSVYEKATQLLEKY